MTAVRHDPCQACPYRKDVPSGVWVYDEYEKLRDYDKPTGEQPWATFGCHVSIDHHCHGWAVVHMNRGRPYELLALRLHPPEGGIPEPGVPLFESGNEAADHGQRDVDDPSEEAWEAMDRLQRKHPRLRPPEEPPTQCPECTSASIIVDIAGRWWVCNDCHAQGDDCNWEDEA